MAKKWSISGQSWLLPPFASKNFIFFIDINFSSAITTNHFISQCTKLGELFQHNNLVGLLGSSGSARLQFKGDISLCKDLENADMINLIWQDDSNTLHQIITTIRFVDYDRKRLHSSQFIFGDVVKFGGTQDIEPTSWYYDRKWVVHTLFPLECHNSLLYFKPYTEERLMKWDLTARQDSLSVG